MHDGVPVPDATEDALTLPDLTAADSGNYRLRITSGDTIFFSQNTLTLNVLPFPPTATDPDFNFTPLANTLRYSNAIPSVANSLVIRVTYLDYTFTYLRIAADGTVDPPFALPTSVGEILASLPDGGLLTSLPPYRTDINGQSVGFALPAAFDANLPIAAALATSDGGFYLAQGSTLLHFLPDGSVDPSFTFDSSEEAGITGLNVDPTGRLYVRGQRNAQMPYDWPPQWPVLYRIAGDGSIDPSFARQEGDPFRVAGFTFVPLSDGHFLYHSSYHGYRAWHLLDENGEPVPEWSASLFTERPIFVDGTSGYVYLFETLSELNRYRITPTGLERDHSFYLGGSTRYFTPLALTPDGYLLIGGSIEPDADPNLRHLTRLRTDFTATSDFPPQVTLSPSTYYPLGGSTVTFSAQPQGEPPFTYAWLALDGQTLPVDATGETLTLPDFTLAQLGRYQVRITNAHGSSLSNVVDLSLDLQNRPYLANLSGRAAASTGEASMVAGCTFDSPGLFATAILARGVGPTLEDFHVHDVLPNPALDLTATDGTLLANNDNWGDDWQGQPTAQQVRDFSQAAGAFPLREQSLDAALTYVTEGGQFTFRLFDQLGRTGNGLLEIYRVPNPGALLTEARLTNLSLRAFAGQGDATATAGFVIEDPLHFNRSLRVLLRVVGPRLADFGVSHPLTDPVLELHNAAGEVIRTIDDWSDNADPAALTATMASVGAFALSEGSADAAVVLDLPAGAYTLTATSKGDDTGMVLLEIYLLP